MSVERKIGSAMSTRRAVLAYEDYAALPDDGRRYEIHDGELSVTPSPGVPHQELSANLGDLLRAHVKEGVLGKVLKVPRRSRSRSSHRARRRSIA